MFLKKRGQVWVETVIYTLIAFVIIGIVLAFAKPKIQEAQDKALLEQSVQVLRDVDDIIDSVIQGGPGNRRLLELGLKKGNLRIDGATDRIVFEMESNYQYSEPGKEVDVGIIKAKTEEIGRLNLVSLTLDYSNQYNITFEGLDNVRTLGKSSVPHKIFVFNEGRDKIIGTDDCPNQNPQTDCTEFAPEGTKISGCVENPVGSMSYFCEYTEVVTTIDVTVE